MTEYFVMPGADDGTPVEKRPHYVMSGGFCHHMRTTKRGAKWVATRMNKGLAAPDEDKMTPEQIRDMEEDTPE